MLTDLEAMQALRELQVVEPVLEARTVAERAAAILDRSTLAQLDLTAYLQGKGITGPALARAIGRLASAVALEYERAYGARPLKRFEVVNGRQVRVNVYLEADRPVIDAVYHRVLEHDHETTSASCSCGWAA